MKVITTIVIIALVAGAGFVVLGRADTERATRAVQDRVTGSSEQIAKDPAGYARHVQGLAESVVKGYEAGIIDLSRQRNELIRYRDPLARNLAAGEKALRELAELRRGAQPGTTETFVWRDRSHTLEQLDEQLVSLDEDAAKCRAALAASARTLDHVLVWAHGILATENRHTPPFDSPLPGVGRTRAVHPAASATVRQPAQERQQTS
jgi:hypothetical protein